MRVCVCSYYYVLPVLLDFIFDLCHSENVDFADLNFFFLVPCYAYICHLGFKHCELADIPFFVVVDIALIMSKHIARERLFCVLTSKTFV